MNKYGDIKRFDKEKLGDFLKKARRNAKLSRRKAAEKLFINEYSLKNYENGYNVPKTECMLAMAKLYGFGMDILYAFLA